MGAFRAEIAQVLGGYRERGVGSRIDLREDGIHDGGAGRLDGAEGYVDEIGKATEAGRLGGPPFGGRVDLGVSRLDLASFRFIYETLHQRFLHHRAFGIFRRGRFGLIGFRWI